VQGEEVGLSALSSSLSMLRYSSSAKKGQIIPGIPPFGSALAVEGIDILKALTDFTT